MNGVTMRRSDFIHQLLISWLEADDCERAIQLAGVATSLADGIHKVIPFDGENLGIGPSDSYDPSTLLSYLECPWCGHTRYRDARHDVPADTVSLRCSATDCNRSALITRETWDQIRSMYTIYA